MKTALRVTAIVTCIGVAAMIVSVTACNSDIRPDSVRAGIDDEARAQGRAWLAKCAAAHGGLERWRALRDARVVLTDSWPSLVMRVGAMPWPATGQRLEAAFLLGTGSGRLTHLGGASDGLVWGVQNWVAWHQAKGGKPVYEPDADVKFWVPTVAYFLELPFRLPEAEIVAYAGDAVLDGRPHARVFATWGGAEPQDAVDQYVVYIDRETHLVGSVFYTVRDFFAGLTGAMRYRDYREVDGLKIAFEMTATAKPDSSIVMHVMRVEEAHFGVGKPADFYIPDPKRIAQKE